MTPFPKHARSAHAPTNRWVKPPFLVSVVAIPTLTLIAMLLWQDRHDQLYHLIQLAFGWAVVCQLILVIIRAFTGGWLELFAYVLHFMAIGAASLSVTFGWEQVTQGMLYEQMALLGLAGQLMIGSMMLTSGPIRQRSHLDVSALSLCIVIVCSAALIKFGYYIRFVGLAGGYSDVFTEGDALRDSSPAIVRILAAGAPLIGLLAISQRGLPLWCRLLGVLAILLEFVIGVRSRPLFLIMSALVLMQGRIALTLPRKILIAFAAVGSVFALAAIGYYREGYQSTATEYFWIVIESLFGIFEASVLAQQLPGVAHLAITQVKPLLAPTSLFTIDTVAKLLSATYTPVGYMAGYGYSSSALTEIGAILGLVWASLAYPLAVLGILILIRKAVESRRVWLFLYGCCILPVAFYIWRAELWQLAVPAIKGIPFIVILLGAHQLNRLGRRRSHVVTSQPHR